MYVAAFKKLKRLASSSNLSIGSSRLWQRLVTEFNGVLVIADRTGHPLHRLKVKSWTEEKGLVYPVFMLDDGTTKSLQQISENDFDSWRLSNKSSVAAQDSYYQIGK